LIGPLSRDPAESVGAVNKLIIEGLPSSYSFTAMTTDRSVGQRHQARLNFVNTWYLIKHLLRWIYYLVRYSPAIAHYGITSGWNREKSLMMLSVAKLFGARTVGHLHGGSFLKQWTMLPTWRKTIAFKQLRSLDALIVLSEGWRQAVLAEIDIADSRVFVVNNPIDCEFERAALKMNVHREGANVLCFGVMDPHKGIFDILHAAAIVDPQLTVTFHLVGPEREVGLMQAVLATIKKLKIDARITIEGPVFGEAKQRLFREAAMFLLPSHAENFPLSVIEAAAAGLPIIATAAGAIPEFFVDGVSALFVPKHSPKHIAEAVSELLICSAKRAKLGNRARELFLMRLGRREILRSLVDVYEGVITPASSGQLPRLHAQNP
jgi:glycosyltransferase involved in cell wall biosynthesis